MIPIDFQGKVALVTGVGDNESFAWSISKSLQAAGAKIVLGCHPRMVNIVRSLIDSDDPTMSRREYSLTVRRIHRRRGSCLRRFLRFDG